MILGSRHWQEDADMMLRTAKSHLVPGAVKPNSPCSAQGLVEGTERQRILCGN